MTEIAICNIVTGVLGRYKRCKVVKKILITAILFSIFPIAVFAESTPDATDAIKQQLTTFIEKNNLSGAAVQIYRASKPQTIYLGDAKASTHFDISALSEIMLGLLLAQQVDAAKVQLTTTVENKITLRSLATNTSGLPANATDTTSTYPVDKIWQPSTLGTMLLTKALENAAHKNLAALYQRQIFAVLGMRSAKLTASELSVTAPDMQKFLAAAIGLPGIPESVSYPMKLTQSVFVELPDRMIGLGWDINVRDVADASEANNIVKEVLQRPIFKPHNRYEKTASSAYIAVLPSKKSGVVILLSKPVSEEVLSQFGRQIITELDA